MLPDNMELLSGNYKNHYDGLNSDVRMIAYYDSTGCTNCALFNFNVWTNFINTVESHSDRASIIFIFSPRRSDLLHVKDLLDKYVVDYPVYLDTSCCFSKMNPTIHGSFYGIINKDNKVLISGYPFESSNINKQYYKLLNLL